MKGSRTWLVMPAAALGVAAVVGGAALMVHTSPPATDSDNLNPTAIPTNSRTGGPAAARNVTVPVYFLGDTTARARLFREVRSYQGVVGWSKLRVAVSGAVLGDATDPDYRSAFPKGTSAHASQDGDTVIVDLGSNTDLTTVNAFEGEVGIQAILYTVDAVLQRSAPVRFRVNGLDVDQVLGVDTTQPVKRAAADSVLAPVWIRTPGNQSGVGSPFKVTGMAATFEANVVWELKDGERVVRHGFATAKECCTQSPYSFTVRAPPGNYTLVVHDTDDSGSGGPVNSDSREITVR